MICCSIHNSGLRRIQSILKRVEMAEIRLDSCTLTDEQIGEIFSSDVPLIATCRAWAPSQPQPQCEPHPLCEPQPQGEPQPQCEPQPQGEPQLQGEPHSQGVNQPQQPSQPQSIDAERKLALAIRSGAHYVDLEIEAPKPVSKRLAQLCREEGTVMIRSYHNYGTTPGLDELRAIVDKCRQHDGDIVKIATTANTKEDAERVLSLYKYYTPESLIAFAMNGPDLNPEDNTTRIDCLAKGAPLSYCAPTEDEATAPGQMGYEAMYSKVYGGIKPFSATNIRVPSSKSYAQRAIIAAALAEGTSTLTGYTDCGDSQSAISVAKTLGATITRKRGSAGTATLEITGIAARPDCLRGPAQLSAGESGLLARLIIPLACQLYSQPVEIQGEGTLLNRELQGLTQTMEALGATVKPGISVSANNPAKASATVANDTLPLTVSGPLLPGYISIDGSKTSQLISGAVMALPLSERNTTIKVQSPTSIPYLYMTLDILRKVGIKVRSEMYGGRRMLDDDWSKCTEIVLKIKENQFYKAADLPIEGDWSAAAVFLAAGAIFGDVTLTGLDTTSLQADLCMLDLLMDAGASLSQLDAPTGTVSARKAPLTAITADLSNSPDLFPVIAVACAFFQGRSTLGGVHRLVHKESDRASGILDMLTRLGVKAEIKGDKLIIEGQSLDSRILTGHLLKGGNFTSSADHRMVMALSLASLGADAPITIDNVECVAKSFPDFNRIWNEHVR